MISGLGIDIVEVQRIQEKLDQRKAFIEKVFSIHEIQYCFSCVHPAEHFAGRFAAKEAFLKATGLGLTLGFELSDIEIIKDKAGKPKVNLLGQFNEYARTQRWQNIHVSITHTETTACAVVIIEQ